MGGLFGQGAISAIISLFIAQIGLAEINVSNVNKQEVYVGAQYVAEASINKQLYSIKSEDVSVISRFSEKLSAGKTRDMQYGFVNEGANAGYFDANFKNAPDDTIDLGDIYGGDMVFKNIQSDNFFNTLNIDYNKGSSFEKIEVIILRYSKSSANPCDFDDYKDGTCADMQKFVVNTADSSQNGIVYSGYQAFFRSGENGYNNRVVIQGFNPDFYNYRVTFGTISGKSSNFSYGVQHDAEIKKITNNMVEIDTIGTSIDNFARMKLQKRISDEISPLSKYVLFSDGEIAK